VTRDSEERGGHSIAATTDHLPGATMMVVTMATKEDHPEEDLAGVEEEEAVGASVEAEAKTGMTVLLQRLMPATTL